MKNRVSNREILLVVVAVAFIAILISGCTNNSADFVSKTAQGGMAEIHLSQIALQRASSDPVKRFAQQLIAEHTRTNNELKQIAAQKGIQLPTEITAEQKSMIDRLSNLSGPEFDKEYMKHMVEDHQKDVSEFQKQAESGTDADVKAFAAKTLPTLQKHLQMSRDTVAKIEP